MRSRTNAMEMKAAQVARGKAMFDVLKDPNDGAVSHANTALNNLGELPEFDHPELPMEPSDLTLRLKVDAAVGVGTLPTATNPAEVILKVGESLGKVDDVWTVTEYTDKNNKVRLYSSRREPK